MKNLQVFRRNNVNLGFNIIGQCIDADNNILYVLDEKLQFYRCVKGNYSSKPELEPNQSFNVLSVGQDSIGRDGVILVEFIVEKRSILIALSNGHLVLLNVLGSGDSFYKHSTDLSSVKVSPDQDLIALADKENNLYILNIEGEVCYTSNALKENESLHKPVGVGWGSKETQFFGLDGRPSKEQQMKSSIILDDEELAKLEKIESSSDYKKFLEKQEKSTVVDWRGDGQYLATLTYLSDTNKHYLKVWNRNLELQYMSEQLVDIEPGLLAWIPDGRYICCAQRRDKMINEIVMFEKNGMVHQRVSLPRILKFVHIRVMAWSLDSKVFALIVDSIQDETVSRIPYLLLFTTQNFQYYLKFSQSLTINCEFMVAWDTINLSRLHLISSNGYYDELVCNFVVNHSKQLTTVAVVDANKLYITPMQLCNIPPPMSAITLIFDRLIRQIAINPFISNHFIILQDGCKLTFSVPETTASSEGKDHIEYSLETDVATQSFLRLKKFRSIHCADSNRYEHLTIVNQNYFVVSSYKNHTNVLLVIKLPQNLEQENLDEIAFSTQGPRVLTISPNQDPSLEKILVILENYSTITLHIGSQKIETLFSFASIAPNFNFIATATVKISSTIGLISLGQDYTLRFNDTIIASSSCTSFRITKDFLVYTSTDNFLHFMLLDKLLLITNSTNEVGSTPSWCQPIESGGFLIAVCDEDSKVILQMPRGNLEILHPRMLVFSALTDLMDKKRYIESIKLARRHRLNMNILCDYLMCRSDWLEELNSFANDIATHDTALLNLFITELSNENTINGRYETITKNLPKREVDFSNNVVSTEKLSSSKINAILTAIKLPKDQKLIQPTLLRLLKMEPKEVGEALRIVHSLDKSSQNSALKFMLYFIDIDQLFLESLRTYSTDICLMVASASNKDPKEYLALLSGFDSIEDENYRCYEIDMHVKDYEKALEHLFNILNDAKTEFTLIEMDNQTCRVNNELFEKIIALIREKRLYKQARAFLYSQSSWNRLAELIWRQYGDYLLEKRHYTSAGIAFSKALQITNNEKYFTNSFSCFMMNSSWEECIAMIASCKVPEDLKEKSLQKISKQFMQQGMNLEATFILQKNNEVSIHHVLELIVARDWYLADFIVNEEDRPLIQQSLQDSVVKHISRLLDQWTRELDCASHDFGKLKKLLETPKITTAPESNQYFSDTLSTVDGSEVSSISAGTNERGLPRSGASSIKTKNSSNTTRSQTARKKRINLKEGSRHEDLALTLELKKFLSIQKQMHEDATRVMNASLYYFRKEVVEYEDKSRSISYIELEKLMTNMKTTLSKSLDFCKEVCDSLWPVSPNQEQKYSLYRRFGDVISISFGVYENIDFEVLIRPSVPKDLFLPM